MELERLKNLELHDSDITAITFAVEAQTLDIRVDIYNEESQLYDELKLLFIGVSAFAMEVIEEWYQLEIYSHEVNCEQNVASISFCLLTGGGKPSATLSLDFTDHTIQIIPAVQ